MRDLLYRDIFQMLKDVPNVRVNKNDEYPKSLLPLPISTKPFFPLFFNVKKKVETTTKMFPQNINQLHCKQTKT